MKLASYKHQGKTFIAAIVEDRLVDLRLAYSQWLMRSGRKITTEALEQTIPGDMTQLLTQSNGDISWLTLAIEQADESAMRDLDRCQLLAPVPRPRKILGIGRNYGAHANEGGLERQEQPRIFSKAVTSVIGPGAAIVRPGTVTKLDWEVELGVIVGRTMQQVSEADALDYVAGYTVLNDVSAREFQFDVSPPQTSFAKSMDTFTPMGPLLITRDEVTDPARLELRSWINNTLMQDGSTADMIFPVAQLLSYLSRYITLEPGDVIATGTPSGVGCFRSPPVYLQPGDRIRMEIAGIGVLENWVTEAPSQADDVGPGPK